MVWHSIVQHFQHFDQALTEGVYQHGCHLTGHRETSKGNQQDQSQTAAAQNHNDGLALIIGYLAARRPTSRTAFH